MYEPWWYKIDLRGYTEFQYWAWFPDFDPDQNPDLAKCRGKL